MSTTTTSKRIEEIRATPSALVGSDEGTHAGRISWRIYEQIGGHRFAVKMMGGTALSTWPVEDAAKETRGNIRMFPGVISRMAALRAELQELQAAKT
ncbi:MAG: hypothetical protein E6Q97_08955 [Desulfurellales bacterium]|nr:MAG: hypothetical protein E6Q97_08955 [Desulfurellales bacterium]